MIMRLPLAVLTRAGLCLGDEHKNSVGQPLLCHISWKILVLFVVDFPHGILTEPVSYFLVSTICFSS